jgi:hypothetical protein
MEYDSPIFIAAVKKILRDGISHLSDGLDDLKNSVTAHWEADEEHYQTKPVTVADLRTDVPIRIQTEAQYSKPERVWRCIIGALEAAAFIAIIAYTIFAYHQWKEMITANDVSMANYRRIRIDANEQLKQTMIAGDAATKGADAATKSLTAFKKQFQMDQRPHVAIIAMTTIDVLTGGKGNGEPEVGKPTGATILFKNVGKSTALNVIIHKHMLLKDTLDQLGPEPPDQGKEGITLEAESTQLTTAISMKHPMEHEPIYSPSNYLVWDGTWPIVVFGRISYNDTFGALYCTPFLAHRDSSGNLWVQDTTFTRADKTVMKTSDLCPVGKP